MAANWIANVRAKMEKKKTVGAFTKQATQADEGVQEYAENALAPGSTASTKTKRRAQFAKNIGKVARKHGA